MKIYLPEILSEEESRELVISTIEEISASDISQMGQVMSMVMKKGKGKVDGTLANEIVSSNDPVSTSVVKKTRNRPISPPIKLNIEDSNIVDTGITFDGSTSYVE